MEKRLSLLPLLFLLVAGCTESGEQYHAREVGGSLRYLYAKWEELGRPEGFVITNYFYIGHTTNQAFFFTNRVRLDGLEYDCRFAIRSPERFHRPGTIALTDEGILLWLGDDGTKFASPDKRWFSSE